MAGSLSWGLRVPVRPHRNVQNQFFQKRFAMPSGTQGIANGQADQGSTESVVHDFAYSFNRRMDQFFAAFRFP